MAVEINTSLTALVKAEFAWSYENALSNSTTRDQDALRHAVSLADGTGDHQADVMWHDRRTVTLATGIDDIDLAGVLDDVFGQSISFATIKGLLIRNNESAVGEDLKVGGAGAGGNAWSAPFDADPDAVTVVKAGGALLLIGPLDGYPVVAGSEDVLRIEHDGTTTGGDISYDLVLIGTTA